MRSGEKQRELKTVRVDELNGRLSAKLSNSFFTDFEENIASLYSFDKEKLLGTCLKL